jgi:hypothetical protein
MNYESCPYKAWLKHGEKIPETGDRTAADRGTAVHLAAEHYVNGTRKDLAPELEKFKAELDALRRWHSKGKVSLEGEWGFDRNWQPTEYFGKDVWCRMKCDTVVFPTPDHAIVVDFKTGKRFGNEVKHGEQMQLYQLGTLQRYPKIKTVEVELWYTDLDDLVPNTFTRERGLSYMAAYTTRAAKMTDATQFPPRPNVFSCTRCPYGPNQSGHCKAGFTTQGLKQRQRGNK